MIAAAAVVQSVVAASGPVAQAAAALVAAAHIRAYVRAHDEAKPGITQMYLEPDGDSLRPSAAYSWLECT